MAEPEDKAAESAEKAYAAAVAEVKPAKDAEAAAEAPAEPAKAGEVEPTLATVEPATPAKPKPEPAKVAVPAKPARKPAAKKPAVRKPAPKPAAAPKPVIAAVKPKPAARAKPKPAAKIVMKPETVSKPKNTKLKEPMKMAKSTDFTAPMTEAMAEMQDKAKAAYDKSTAIATEMGEFTKGNMEAVVESGKILSTAMQDIGKSAVEDAKSAFETITADMKEMAAVKSPTDLFQLQSKLMRRNFDALVAYGSKASESMVKLTNDAMAPISGRMSTAADMVSKVA